MAQFASALTREQDTNTTSKEARHLSGTLSNMKCRNTYLAIDVQMPIAYLYHVARHGDDALDNRFPIGLACSQVPCGQECRVCRMSSKRVDSGCDQHITRELTTWARRMHSQKSGGGSKTTTSSLSGGWNHLLTCSRSGL